MADIEELTARLVADTSDFSANMTAGAGGEVAQCAIDVGDPDMWKQIPRLGS